MYTNTIDGGFAINRFEVLADLQATVSTLLNVCFPGECRQNAISVWTNEELKVLQRGKGFFFKITKQINYLFLTINHY